MASELALGIKEEREVEVNLGKVIFIF